MAMPARKRNNKNFSSVKFSFNHHHHKILNMDNNKINNLPIVNAKTIDISKDYVCYVCKRIYDLLTDYEVNNNCYLENKNHMPFKRNVCRDITRIALIPFETCVTIICFLNKKGYRTIVYRKTDTEPYHDYIVRKYKQTNLNYGKGCIREITPLD